MDLKEQIDGLAKLRNQLAKQAEDARLRAQACAEDLQRVETALAALTGDAPPKRSGKPGAGSVKTAEVEEEIVLILRASPKPIPEQSLKDEVKKRLKDKGKRLTGYGVRFPQALKSTKFVVEDGHVKTS